MAGKPMWRRAYDSVERPVGSRLESAVQTDAFAEVAGLLVHARAGLSRQVERSTRHVWHRINLPAASDIARLRDQVSSLERTLRALDDAMRRESGATPTGGPTSGSPGTTRRAGGADGAHDGSSRPGGAGTPRRRAQPAAGPQRRQVRDRDRPA